MKKTVFIATFVAIFLIITSSAGAQIVGIDVSRWQEEIDWETTAPYISFAIIKAGGSDAGLYQDKRFEYNRQEARRLDIPRGYYYYAGGGDPYQEAEHFAGIIGSLQPGELVVLDYEIDHPDPVAYSLKFLKRTEQLLGVKPLLYTNMKRVWTNDWQPVVRNGNRLWGAIYDEVPSRMPEPGAWTTLTMKQYTSKGRLPGIGSRFVDLNYFNGNIADFLALGYGGETRPSAAALVPPAAAIPVPTPEVPPMVRQVVMPAPVVAPEPAIVQPDEDVDERWKGKINDEKSLYYQPPDDSLTEQ